VSIPDVSALASGVHWRKASYCGDAGCVEVAVIDGLVAVRDSKENASPVLTFTSAEWRSFVAGVKHGEFDLS
jgi:hypothetical protein